jgi:TPR repeat protein
MRTIAKFLLAMLCSAVGFAAEAVNWREIWDGEKRDWWNKPIPELRKLVEQKNPFATLILADKLIYTDRVEAVKLRRKAVDYGLPQAMVWLSEDPETAPAERISLITRAAELGFTKAQVALAAECFHRNVRPEYDKTLASLRSAVDQGDEDAMRELAGLYAAGIGEPRNEQDRPINLLRAAARKGDAFAAQELEKRLRLGIGASIDLLESSYFYFHSKSPQNNSPMTALSRQAELRNDPNKEILQRLDALFEDAFTRRSISALIDLAKLHETGTYGQTNLARAYAFLTIANSTEVKEKTKTLSDVQKQAMERELKSLRGLQRNE